MHNLAKRLTTIQDISQAPMSLATRDYLEAESKLIKLGV
jgi:hypothetical protein